MVNNAFQYIWTNKSWGYVSEYRCYCSSSLLRLLSLSIRTTKRWFDAAHGKPTVRAENACAWWRSNMTSYGCRARKRSFLTSRTVPSIRCTLSTARQHLVGKKDYWATPPRSFCGSNAGDCEDFTTSRPLPLAGARCVPDKKLRLVYVKAPAKPSTCKVAGPPPHRVQSH